MNTKIELVYNEVPYTLEYNRASVKVLEAQGFKLDEFLDKPMTNIELVFQGAFIKNHPHTSLNTISNILNECPDKNNLISTLHTMIEETYNSLLSNGDSGNVTWKIVDLSPKSEESQK